MTRTLATKPRTKPGPHLEGVKAIFFDLMGTCLDWHGSIKTATGFQRLSDAEATALALDWRQGFFDEIHSRFEKQLAQENIDATHRRVLDHLLQHKWSQVEMSDEERENAVQRWHCMKPWSDAHEAIERLRTKYDVCVLANGTTRLQLDLMRSSGLNFSMLFSSELLGLTKPDPQIYKRAMELIGVKYGESLMVAAHAYDLRAARAVGMRTVYVQRWTEDQSEDMDTVEEESDFFISESHEESDSSSQGLTRLCEMLGLAQRED